MSDEPHLPPFITENKKYGLNNILILLAILLFLATFIWDKGNLTIWFSLWISATSIALAVMILFMLYDFYQWIRNKMLPDSLKETTKTVFIILIADIILLNTSWYYWIQSLKMTAVSSGVIILLLLLFLLYNKLTTSK